MPPVLEVLLVLALFGAGMVGIVAFSRWHAARIERFWRATAERMGGTLRFEAGWFDVTCSLSVEVDGHEVTLTRGRKQGVFARAAAKQPAGFELKLYPRPPAWLSSGANAVATGDPVFDALFAVETTDVELAKRLLDPAVCDRISRAGAVWLHVRDGAVAGNRAIYEFESDALENLARAVAALAA